MSATHSDTHGTTHVLGAVVRAAHDGAGLLQTLSDGLALRCTEVTERNANSSRSHAVCALRFCASGRTLRLADLAGSERNLDTVGMSAAEHRASAEINKALFALKECFRMAALHGLMRLGNHRAVTGYDGGLAGIHGGIKTQHKHVAGRRTWGRCHRVFRIQTILQASLNARRGERGSSLASLP